MARNVQSVQYSRTGKVVRLVLEVQASGDSIASTTLDTFLRFMR